MADSTYAVQARGLVKTYPHGGSGGTPVEAVRGVDLEVADGETFGFLGPNGAGKTTTIAMLCALAVPTAGRAWVHGADVAAEAGLVRQRVGYLFQTSSLDDGMTARQNLYVHARLYGLSRRYARRRVARLLELAGVAERARQPVRTYSGGMRRRLEIARGLLHQPRVLFLDEPTVGLDPHARAQIWEHLNSLPGRTPPGGRRTTLFVTTHYLDEAENCDRIAIIDQGRIVVSGTPERLKAAIGRDQLHLRTDDNAAVCEVARNIPELREALASQGPPGPSDPAKSVAPPGGEGVALRVREASAWLPRLCAALAQRGVTVYAATATPPTLDDVFFHHTGRNISVDPTAAPALGGPVEAPPPGGREQPS
ncbi:ATP-binding cassette domain-containing protein [Streptomyces sp. 891-h]|uniref:ATP-binding cassette domain-containing protein n=1 Tax=Streptomyces sp. 891-h TaxID=2720714 RepID=UPI00325BD892